MTPTDHFIYAAAWLAFGLLHSMTAGASSRTGLGRLFGRAHRLAYNALAAAQIAAVLAVGAWRGEDAQQFSAPWLVLAMQYAMVAIGLALGLVALRAYRAGPFIGWAQLAGQEDDSQPLVTNALHARVRHPLYTALFFILWGGVRDELGLATAMWGSLYLYVGSMFEERRLVARYGESYRSYRKVTPRFLPRFL